MKKRVVSGIQPTGVLHVGNYLGSVKNFVSLQDQYQCFYFIADYHSITESFNPREKQQQIKEVLLDLLAAGLDPQKCILFIQSQVPEHLELAWIFNCITPISELKRMTQYKDKAEQQRENINAGLFDYPVLQAADILIYKPLFVPVGQDQVQHIELTRTIARIFNHTFGPTFELPNILLTKTPKIMSLSEPTKKMSKSLGEKSFLALNDEPSTIKNKLSRAVTDIGTEQQMSPGVLNLFTLVQAFSQPSVIKQFQQQRQQGTISYQELKETLAQDIGIYFKKFRSTRKALAQKDDYLRRVIAEGTTQARSIAQQTLKEVKAKIGLL